MTKEKAPISKHVDEIKLSTKEKNNAKKEETRLLFEVRKVLFDAKEQTKAEIIEKKRSN